MMLSNQPCSAENHAQLQHFQGSPSLSNVQLLSQGSETPLCSQCMPLLPSNACLSCLPMEGLRPVARGSLAFHDGSQALHLGGEQLDDLVRRNAAVGHACHLGDDVATLRRRERDRRRRRCSKPRCLSVSAAPHASTRCSGKVRLRGSARQRSMMQADRSRQRRTLSEVRLSQGGKLCGSHATDRLQLLLLLVLVQAAYTHGCR